MQACKLKCRLRELTSCLCSAAALAVCLKGRVAGLDATETGIEFSQLKFYFTSLTMSTFMSSHITLWCIVCIEITICQCTWCSPNNSCLDRGVQTQVFGGEGVGDELAGMTLKSLLVILLTGCYGKRPMDPFTKQFLLKA